MDLLNLSLAEFETFMFVFFRVGAMILLVPILGSRQIPATMKVGLVLFLSLAIFPVVMHQPMPQPRGVYDLGIHLLTDALIGVAIGFITRLLFAAVQVAGTVIDFQMGFGVVNVIDPQTQSQVSITAQFQNILVVLIFLASDAHHILIRAVKESFFLIDPNTIDFAQFTPDYMVHVFLAMFVVAVKIAAPIMAILFFISVGLGLVARTVPQMNVFIVGFPLQIGVGLFMIAASIPLFSLIIQNEIMQLPARLLGLMRSL